MCAQTPAGYWKFDEAAGIHAADASGHGHTATLSSQMKWIQGMNGGAIAANSGAQGFVSIPAIDLSATNAVTISLWTKRTYSPNGGGVLFEAGSNYRNSTTGFALLPDDETCHGIQAVLQGNEGKTANCYTQPSSGVWHHLAVVLDKTQTGGNAIAFYVDGELQSPNWNPSAATNTNNFGNDPIYLFASAGVSQFSSGAIDDLRIYDGGLSPEQIQQIYNGAGGDAPSGVISYVQSNYATPQSSQTTVSVTYTAAQVAGDLNVVAVGWNDSTATVSSVTDTKGNTYTRAIGPTVQSGYASQSIYYAKNIVAATAGTNAVKVTFSRAAVSPDIRILEYSGADHTNPVDVAVAASGNSGSSSSGSATTTNATDLIFGANIVQTLTSGPGSGFTKRQLTQPDGDISEDKMVTTTGSYSAVAPLAYSGPWIMQMVAFRTPSSLPTLTSIAVTPANPSITAGGQQQFTATGTYSDGSHQDLTDSATWTSSSTTVATINSTGMATGVAAGTTTIKATSGTISGSTTLTVTAAGSFTISASPASLSVAQGNQGSSTITTVVSGGFNSSIALSASGIPSGTTVSFSPATIPAPGGGSSSMTMVVGAGTATGTYPIVVTGNGGGVQKTTTVTLTVTGVANFVITASPTSLTVAQGNHGTSTLTTTISGGFNSSISLSSTGAPSGATVSFSPNPIPAPGSGTSTMTVTVGSSTPTGTYSIVVTASGGGIQQNAVISLTVTAVSATISYVQGNYATPQGSQTSVSVPFNAAQVAGDLNVVSVGWNDSTATVSSVTDTKGNTYTRAIGPTVQAGYATQSIYYAKNIVAAAAGSNSVTVAFSAGATSPDVRVLEYSGADHNNPVDIAVAGSGNSTSSSSGSATTTNPTDLIFGANLVQTLTSGPGNGLTSRMITQPDGDIAEDQMATTTGSYSATAPLSSSGPWIMQMVAFRTPSNLPTLVSISVTPTNPSITAGGQQQFTATGNYSDGSHQNLTNSATWTSSATTVATINSTGMATGVAAGTTTIQAASGTIAGSTTLTVTTVGSFAISASPASLTVSQGNQGTSTITASVSGGFNSSIALSASGTPSGTTVSFSPSTISAPGNGSSTMTIIVGSGTAAGSYPITVTGNGGGVQQSTTVTLTVTAVASFSISASPASLTVMQGYPGTSTITTAISVGFNGAISLSTSGAPTGTTVALAPTTIPAPGSGTSTLTVNVGMNTPMGTYTITVTGTSGGTQHTATVNLTVTAEVMLSWTASGSPGIAGYNAYRSTTSGGPYTKVNSGLISSTNYNDTAVQNGYTYYYVTTAVNNQGMESSYSNESSAYVP